MGGRTAKQIKERLLDEGAPADLPVTICSSVSRANSRSWQGNIASLNEGIEEIGFDEPVLIGVGHVFKMAKQAAKNSEISNLYLAI